MSDPAKPPVSSATTPTVTSASLDWKLAESYFQEVRAKIFTYEGKNGFNPHLWWWNNGKDIEASYAKGVRTPELHASMLRLKFAEPVANPRKGFVFDEGKWVATESEVARSSITNVKL